MTKQFNGTENKEINGKLVTVGCISFNTTKDEDNVNNRGFCEKHMQEVKKIRKIMHKKCINKEKIIPKIKDRCNILNQKIKLLNNNDLIGEFNIRLFELENLIQKIENGDFDND